MQQNKIYTHADTSLAEGQNEEAEEPVTSLSQDCMLAQQQLDELLALNRGAASALLRHEEELIDGLGQFDAMLRCRRFRRFLCSQCSCISSPKSCVLPDSRASLLR